MAKAWAFLAAVVFAVAFVAHAVTFFSVVIPGSTLMVLGIFPIFVPAIYYVNRSGADGRDAVNSVAKHAPKWLIAVTLILFLYNFVNGVTATLRGDGQPHEENGRYTLMEHGRVIREISQREYRYERAYEARMFSSAAMCFASVSCMLLVGAARTANRSLEHQQAAG